MSPPARIDQPSRGPNPIGPRAAGGRARPSGEDGSVTAFVVLMVFLVALLIGFVVDASGVLHARQRAAGIAREAARSAAQEIDRASLTGQIGLTDRLAQDSARSYMAAAGCQDSQIVVVADSVQAVCHYVYQPTLAGLFTTVVVTGRATAQATHTFEGIPK
ncbi:MAG: Tad domain-containing protein [Propionibacteriaceae bacterium]|jgi:Flp pilus assembly protein TadG|nr:Tad domain-containing protein [Propionibacteriaceae bacterium]